MSGILLPILLFVAAIVATFLTYRNIRRGGARFYTLEREIVLRRAMVTLVAASVLYTAALGLIYMQRQHRFAALGNAYNLDRMLDGGRRCGGALRCKRVQDGL